MPAEYTLNQALEKRWPILVTNDTPGLSKVVMDRPVCVVGARSKVHLPLPSPIISKSHALLVHGPSGVWLRDLGSKNHTFVNNKIVRETRLLNGDLLRFGPFSFRCARGFDTIATPEPLPAAELHLETGRSGAARIFTMARQTFLIGSRYSCDVLLHGDDVSNGHAVIFVRDGRRYLRDLTSISGTLLNGKPVREAELRHGDEIRITSSRMVYYLPDGQIATFTPGSEDSKTGMTAVFRDVKDVAAGKQPGNESDAGIPSPDMAIPSPDMGFPLPDVAIPMPWERPKPVVIDIEEATREENGK